MFGFEESVDWFHTRTLSNLEDDKPSGGSSIDLCKSFFDFTDPTVGSLINFPEEVSELKIKYEDDLNLRQIHSLIREKFVRAVKKLSVCDSEIYQREWKLNYTKMSDLDRTLLKEEIESFKDFKIKQTTVNHWEIYKRIIYPILSKYTPLMSKDVGGSDAPGANISFDDEMIRLRHKYIKDYIDEVNKMGIIKISARCIPKLEIVCPSCMKPIQQDSSVEVGGSAMCSCGFSESTIKHMSEYTDLNRQNGMSTESDLNAKQIKEWIDNIKCTIANVYGKGDDDVKNRDLLFSKFDMFCQSHNLPHRYYVLNGMTHQPNMNTIITLIKLSKKPELYNNKHQIRHDYYNAPIYNISEAQEASVIKMYIDFQNKYEETKRRKTKVHIEILGCVLLMMAGVRVNPSDFKIPSSSETIAYSHNSIFETMGALGYKREQIPDVLSIFS